jgi:lysophospholipase L1-like esterase
MKWLKLVLINVLVFVGLLLLLEAGARVVLWQSPQTPVVKQSFGFSTTGYGDLIPNLDVVETLMPSRPYRLRTNSVGLRNTDELNPDERVFRILAIGDSFTYGFYVHNEEAYPYRLEEVLEQTLEGRFQVLNGGIPGYTVADALSYLRDKGLALEPDLVILGSYTNDIFDYVPRMREFYAREVFLQYATHPPKVENANPLLAWLRDNVALFTLIEQWREQYREAQIEDTLNRVTPYVPGLQGLYQDMTFFNPDAPDYRAQYDALEADIAAMASLLQERGVPLVWVSFPDLIQLPQGSPYSDAPQRFFQRTAEANGVTFVDMLPVFQSLEGDIQALYLKHYNRDLPIDPNNPEYLTMGFEGDGHLSMYGNLITARTVAQTLIARELVPTTPAAR